MPKARYVLGVLFSWLLLLAAAKATAQDAKPAAQGPEGIWTGQLQIGSGELRAVFHINRKGNDFTATMDSPDQGGYGLPCDQVLFQNGKIQIVLRKFGVIYQGKLSDDGKEIAGFWSQGRQGTPLTLSRVAAGLLPPQMLVLAYWIPIIFLSAFFLRLACGLCGANFPSWPRAIISVLLVSFLAYLTVDFTAYVIMRSMQDVVVQVPPSYGYKLWFREPFALKWIIISNAGPVRYLPFVFALCVAGTLQVIILEASVTFRFGLLIVLLQWGATAVAGYIVALLFGVALSQADSITQATPVAHAPPEPVQKQPKPKQGASPGDKVAKSEDKTKGKKTPKGFPEGSKAGEASAGQPADSQPISLQIAKREQEDATGASPEYAQNAWSNLKTYADSHLDELKEELAPLTEQLPKPVQDFLEKGGWWVILGVLGIIALVWLRSLLRRLGGAFVAKLPKRKKKKRRSKSMGVKLKENLRELGDAYTEDGPQRLTVKGVPARLRLVILSLGAKDSGGLSEEMVDRVLDWIKPGLAQVTAPDYPRVPVWPPFFSPEGFAIAFQANVPIPEPKGEKSHWVLVSGQVKMGRALINVGLGLYADEANTQRNLTVKDEQWLGVFGVRETRQLAGAR